MYFKCCVPGCLSTRRDTLLHKFPKCNKRLQKWIESINCDYLRKISAVDFNCLQVCHKHFESCFVTTKLRLLSVAYPTLFLPSEISSGKPRKPTETTEPVNDHNYTKKRHFDHNYCKEIESHPKKIMKPADVENNTLEHEQNNILENYDILVFDKNDLLEQGDSNIMQSNDNDILEHDENEIMEHDENNILVHNEKNMLERNEYEILEYVENEILEHDENNIVEHAESDIMEHDESEIELPMCNMNLSSSLNGDIYTTMASISDPLGIELNDVTESTPAIDPEHLKALEDSHTEIPEWFWNDTKIINEITHRWEPILRNGLKKEVKEEVCNYYFFDKNLPYSKPPIINPEIESLLTEESKNRDNELVNRQKQLGHALTAIGTAMTGLLTNVMNTSDVLKTLNDAGKLIADLHYAETETRRSHFTPELDRFFVEPLKERVRDDYLFGEELNEFVKPSGVKSSSSKVTPGMISTFLNNLNASRMSRRQSYARKKRDGMRLRHSVYTLSMSRPQDTAPVKSICRPLDFPTKPRPRALTEQNEIEIHPAHTKHLSERPINSDSKVIEAVTSLEQPCQRSMPMVLYDGT